MVKVKIDDDTKNPDDYLNSLDEQSDDVVNNTPQDSTVQDGVSNQDLNTDVEEVVIAEAVPAQPDVNVTELLGDLQRTRADFENYRKQVESQKTLAMSAAKYATVEKFLPLVDDFERALDAYPEQLAPLRKNLDKTLSTLGLARIDSAPGTEFNPDLHEAVSVEDDEGDTEVVAETLRPGYLYDGAVIRAAMVKVKHK